MDEVQNTLLKTYPPQLIAAILKALREQLEENGQLNAHEEIAGAVQEILLEYDQILNDGAGFWDDVNGGYLQEDLVLAAKREDFAWVHSEGVYEVVPMQERRVYRCGQEIVGLDLGGHRQVCDPGFKEIRSRLRAREYKTKKQGQNSHEPYLLHSCSLQCTSSSCNGACLNHDVCWLVERL